MTDRTDNERTYWHSRRGMLEIDLALMPFAKKVYPTLSDDEKVTYKALLLEEDTVLFSWILQKSTPENAQMASLVKRIVDFAKQLPH